MASELSGFYYDMPFDVYAAVPALNGSSILHMRRSAMKYRHEKDNPTPPTPAMEMGTLIHRMILEPELVGSIAVWGEEEGQKVRRGRVWDEFRAQHADDIILTVADRDAILGMQRAALGHAPIRHYADAVGRTEVSMFWRHPFTKRRYKARVDKIVDEPLTLVDLKSTFDSRPWRFSTTAHRLGYVVKMANYWNGFRILTGKEPAVKLLALESKAPHESVVFDVSRDLLLIGLEELDMLAAKLDHCEKVNAWPPAELEEVFLELPPWAGLDVDSELDLEM